MIMPAIRYRMKKMIAHPIAAGNHREDTTLLGRIRRILLNQT